MIVTLLITLMMLVLIAWVMRPGAKNHYEKVSQIPLGSERGGVDEKER